MAVPALADECEDVGRQASMLGMLNSQCPKYRLNEAGERAFASLIAKSIPLGGAKCADKGKISMIATVNTPELEALVAKNDLPAFNEALCDAIAKRLSDLAKIAKKPSVFERR